MCWEFEFGIKHLGIYYNPDPFGTFTNKSRNLDFYLFFLGLLQSFEITEETQPLDFSAWKKLNFKTYFC